jgi:DNA modification methylase
MKLKPPACQSGAAAPAALSHLSHRIGPICYRSIDTIRNYKGNPRKHPEKQIVKLKASLQEFGIVLPVLIDTQGEIIVGEAVSEAARRLGVREIPVIEADHLSPSQVKAVRLAHNRLAELSQWDERALAIELESIIDLGEVSIELLGWETAEVDILLEALPAGGTGSTSAVDPADEPIAGSETPVSRIGDLWQLGPHRLMCGSALESASWDLVMDGRKAAMVFADAPYNVPVDGHVCGSGKIKHAEFAMASGEMSPKEFTEFLRTATSAMSDHLDDGSLIFLCMDWRHQLEMLKAIAACGLSLINLCVWNKSNGGMGSLYRSKHELVFVAKKGTAPHTNNVELGRYGRYRTNVWDYAGVNSFGSNRMEDLADHPTVKPVALVADAIRDVTRPGEIVIDGFMGSGTTILAAERTRRTAYGSEIEPRYVDVAIRRFEKLTGQSATLASTGETFADVALGRTEEPEAI